ncbi:MAG TPA: hypothetical protein VHO70_07255 [Chitinispirillaceae bacterium]|nr:hypothetical protein [Chitinispirillaceae bacterium]
MNTRHILYTDPFSYTTPAIQWIDLHWLFQVLSYLVYCSSGYYGLLLLKSFIIATAAFLLLSSIRSLSSLVIIAPLFLFCMFHFRYLVPLRPGILTLLYLSSFLFLFEKYSRNPRTGLLIMLIPIQILWNNTQGLFMIGPAVFALYIAGNITDLIRQSNAPLKAVTAYIKTKQFINMTIIFSMVCISGIITPFGIRGFLFPFRLLKQITPGSVNPFSNLITENTPMFKMIGTDQYYYVLVFALLSIFALYIILSSGKKNCFWHIYLFISFAVLAFMAQRNLILFLFATVPLASNFRLISFKIITNVKKIILCGSLLFVSLYFTFVISNHFLMIQSINNPVSPFCHPAKSTRYLSTNHLKGNIFNADRYGGYLLWHLYPSRKIFIDTRLSMRNRQFFLDYISLLENPVQFDFQSKSYNITAAVLPASVPLYRKLITWLYFHPDWALVMTDGSEALFIRKDQFSGTGIDLKNQVQIDSLFRQIQIDSDFGSRQIKTEAAFRLDKFVQNLRFNPYPNISR